MPNVRERGRPRSFDKEAALQKALSVFADKGYESASLDELTTAMGINRPSLYAAFGNKENLFLQALEAYGKPLMAQMREQLFSEPDTYLAFQKFMHNLAELHSAGGCTRGGCLVINSTILSCSEQQVFADALQCQHNQHEEVFYERLELGRSRGDLPADTDCRALAGFFNGVMAGMGVLSRAQRNPETLKNLAKLSLRALPVSIT